MIDQKTKERVEELKRQKNAVILAHYYAPREAQELADFVGDSFYLAKIAQKTDARMIVLCGVGFMGESAKILNPEKKVLMPEPAADCPMAHMVAEGKIAEMRARYEDLAVVCYINSTAALKCQSDVCVTSSNAVKIVRALPNRNIFFIPDRNLGRFVAEQVPEKSIILNDGCCPVHADIDPVQLAELKRAHPDAVVLAHPECECAVLAHADYIGSTAELIAFARTSPADSFIVCTEDGVEFQLKCDSPDKNFYFPKRRPCCPDMKRNTAAGVLHVLETEKNEIEVAQEVQQGALRPLEKMLELAGS
ncbi:MAG: quinolinate synthase NadA [Clostridia bacterium]|nr:quinolinate synthase NadA [Clostridia bacterium]